MKVGGIERDQNEFPPIPVNQPILSGSSLCGKVSDFSLEKSPVPEGQEKGFTLPLQVAVCNSALTNKYSDYSLSKISNWASTNCIKLMSKGNGN